MNNSDIGIDLGTASILVYIKGRGVVLKEGQTLEGLYNERIDLYEKYADIAVDEGEMDFESTLESLRAALAARIQVPGIN